MTLQWSRIISIVLLLVSLGLAVPLLVGGWGSLSTLWTLAPIETFFLLVVMVVVWSLNVIRLRLLFDRTMPRLGYWRLMRIYMATEFVSKTTPLGLAAPAAAVSLLAPHGVSASSSLVVFGVSAFMDAVVLVALIACLAVSELTASAGGGMVMGMLLYAAVMTAVIVGTAMLLYRHKLVYVIVSAAPGFSLTGHRGKVFTRRLVVGLHRALARLTRIPRSRLVLSWLACLLYWGAYMSTLYLCIVALGGDVDWVQAGFIQGVSMGMGHLLMIPGGAGGADITGALLLEPLLGATLAAAVIILWRFLMLYLYLLVGGLSLLSLVRRDMTNSE